MKGCRVLKDNEIRDILNELQVRDRVLFVTCLTFGTRISEALALNFANVEGNNLFIKSIKGSENQCFPIPNYYKKEIKKLKVWYESKGINISSKSPLFISQKGYNKAITRQLAGKVIRNVAFRLGLDGVVSTHSFRKTFVTKIYKLTGYNLVETKSYSRHKSLVNLDYYIQTTETVDLVHQLKWC